MVLTEMSNVPFWDNFLGRLCLESCKVIKMVRQIDFFGKSIQCDFKYPKFASLQDLSL